MDLFAEYSGEKKDENGEDKLILKIPVVKAGTKEEPSYVEVAMEDLPPDVYKACLFLGMKHFVNGGMTKITGEKTEGSRKAAFEIAQKNVQAMYAGEVRMPSGVSRSKVSGAVKTEAMRLARLIIRDAIKASGEKISHYAAKDITEAAKNYLETEHGAETWTLAASNVKERETKKESEKETLKGVLGHIKVDPKLVAKANEKAEAARKPKKDLPPGVVLKQKPEARPTAH